MTMDDSRPDEHSKNVPSVEHSGNNVPRRRAGERRSRTGRVSEEHVLALRNSKTSQKLAARELGICVTALKKLCRGFVIPRASSMRVWAAISPCSFT